ncbi:hypothetical protein [Lactobacillus mulieris]|uniref:ABC transporter permease n=1 Tax=Lactobacillus mulieris TaxID=2508708 RepID=A0AAW5WW80_9LACO|nr:hypothetical protein [Lactobacillus mulieris]MCZ3621560.1 hypothetical protein [Lactobacillus mulieris]MCZ3623164.1 hypothetical protein [Lactobacillus mulieris]MCZ3635567.1 hypothetical protein [Lactobacillus mulieris]MCZ3689325.1 hypothetical protein [Lactobacillus mulieris]MCZ3695328.1 hypothetical protein [Lactobacillus mulieris]
MLALTDSLFQTKKNQAKITLLGYFLTSLILAAFLITGRAWSFVDFSLVPEDKGLPLVMSFSSTLYKFDLLFFVWCIYYFAKDLRKQTWQLVPLSSTKIFTAQWLSTLLACAYLFIGQLLLTFISYVVSYLWASNQVLNGLRLLFDAKFEFLNDLVFLTFFCLAWLLFTALVEICKYGIISILPFSGNKIFENIIEIILVIIGLIIAINGFNFMFFNVGTTEETGTTFMIITSVILWLIVQPLFNRIGESKAE